MNNCTTKNWLLLICILFSTWLSSTAEPQVSWQEIQKQLHNTVVQVFSIIAVFDWLEPYRTPEQKAISGSGFFINEDGYIVTNAHVVDQAVKVWVSLPALGKMPLYADVISICPDSDLALLKLNTKAVNAIRESLGVIYYLELGDSDTVNPTDQVLAAGYPLGQKSLKTTTGVISGYWHHYIQIDAPINPGNSGGPLINHEGKVIGINNSGFFNAQNVGYAIPSNILQKRLPDMYHNKLLQVPWLGIVTIYANAELTTYFGNPQPGGCFVCDVVSNSFAEKIGIQKNDMIYEVDGCQLDIYADMTVPWNKDKVSVHDYVARLQLGQEISFLVYRKGEPLYFTAIVEPCAGFPISKKHPWHEKIDFEVFGGMVIMELTINHINAFSEKVPGLQMYSTLLHQCEPRLVITNIFSDSELAQQNVTIGSTINEINGQSVRTLADFRQALEKSLETNIFTMRSTDEIARMTENVFVVLSFKELCQETARLSHMYHYQLSDTFMKLYQD